MKGEKRKRFFFFFFELGFGYFEKPYPTIRPLQASAESKATHIRLSDNTRMKVSSMMPLSFFDAHQPPLQLRRVGLDLGWICLCVE